MFSDCTTRHEFPYISAPHTALNDSPCYETSSTYSRRAVCGEENYHPAQLIKPVSIVKICFIFQPSDKLFANLEYLDTDYDKEDYTVKRKWRLHGSVSDTPPTQNNN